MADSYDRYDNESSGGGGFMMGLLTGTVLGAGLGMLLAPKAGSELRGAIGEQARNVGNLARTWRQSPEQYKKASETAGHVGRARPRHGGQGARSGDRGADEARGYASGTTGSGYSSGNAAARLAPDRRQGNTGSDFGRS